MKKKLLTLALVAILLAGISPALSFAAAKDKSKLIDAALEKAYRTMKVTDLTIDGQALAKDADGTIADTSGSGWIYAGGILTLDGYQGDSIWCREEAVSSREVLFIRIKGENTLTSKDEENGIRIWGNRKCIIQGGGILHAVSSTENALPPISVNRSIMVFDLDPGGEVQMDVDNDREMAGKIPPEAIYADEGEQNVLPYTGSEDQIILEPGNTVTRPKGGKVGLYTWEAPTSNSQTPVTWSEATAMTAEGELAQHVTIAGPEKSAQTAPAGNASKGRYLIIAGLAVVVLGGGGVLLGVHKKRKSTAGKV